METFNCVPNVTKSKYRPNLSVYSYHNVPRTLRPLGSEYALPNCQGRRSAASISHPHSWPERPAHSVVSPVSLDQKSSRGKLCSIALAIASFIVLVAVLAIAGLALHMGVLHTETPNALLTFSCAAKVLRGDRFIGPLQEKARRYKRQFEALYQRSILGQAFISCVIDKFREESSTVYFKLAFNRKKLSKSISNIEKAIKDILLTDAISRNSVFKNIRFDPRYVSVRQVLGTDNSLNLTSFSEEAQLDTKSATATTRSSVILKSHNKTYIPHTVNTQTVTQEDIDNDEDLPTIQGSFKITKTEADITEKKTDASTNKTKNLSKTTTKKPMPKESSVTSALYKIAAVEKVTKQPITSTEGTTLPSTEKITSKFTTTFKEIETKAPVFIANPYDNDPWIPILPSMEPIANIPPPPIENIHKKPSVPLVIGEPTYTSFTNPGLSFNVNDAERLGFTSLRSHPIPVNKIPSVTEPSIFVDTQTFSSTSSAIFSSTSAPGPVPSGFIEIETLKYVPNSNKNVIIEEDKKEELLENVSYMLDNLPDVMDNRNISSSTEGGYVEQMSGQGQVEVVVDDVDELVYHTTKIPLVTLLPVKSNSGIGRPIRKRPYKPQGGSVSVEDRSFPSLPVRSNLNDDGKKERLGDTTTAKQSLKIFGILNFATEESVDNDDPSDIVRYPKMDVDVKVASKVPGNGKSVNNTSSPIITYPNILTEDEIRQLSEISKIMSNSTSFEKEPFISTKAISSSYTTNHNGLPILKKPLHKVDSSQLAALNKYYNNSDCANNAVICGDGRCLPETIKCNQLIDCNDGKDEENCNCTDYLKSQFLLGKICDGVVDCWDYSDENQCEWCKTDQYVCSNSKVCIDKEKICDGIKDCPQGDDEKQCVTIATDVQSAEEFPYNSEGYLMVRKYGKWGKLCVDNLDDVSSLSDVSWQIPDLGKAVCKSMTYQTMESIKKIISNDISGQESDYFELTYNPENKLKSNLSFKSSTCANKQTMRVRCQSLECGARPQAVKHIARVVGGSNADLGAWPWQAALYKEGEFQCGATLLSNKWLVSAGHCFYHSQEEHWVARLGALRRGTALPSPFEQLKTVVRIIVHPGYIDSGFINDISLLQLESPVTFSDYVRPVCLPQTHLPPADGRLCTIVGWGQLFEVGRIFPDTLQEVEVPIISTAECRKRTLFLPLYRLTDDMFCAGYERGGRDACLGDSGGPLMCPESNGRWTLHGITSNGYGCARANRPGVYTKVANYVDWINFIVISEELNPKNLVLKSKCSGLRCPLGECLSESRLCNGFIECSDGSDEKTARIKTSAERT